MKFHWFFEFSALQHALTNSMKQSVIYPEKRSHTHSLMHEWSYWLMLGNPPHTNCNHQFKFCELLYRRLCIYTVNPMPVFRTHSRGSMTVVHWVVVLSGADVFHVFTQNNVYLQIIMWNLRHASQSNKYISFTIHSFVYAVGVKSLKF